MTEKIMERLLAKIGAMQEKMVSHHEEIMEEMRVWWKEMKAYRDASEVHSQKMEASPEEMKSVAVHEEVLKEEALVNIVGTLKERYRDQHLTIWRRRQAKKRTQGNGRSRKKFAAFRRGLTCCVVPARHKGQGRQGAGKDHIVQDTQKGRTFGKRRQEKPKCNNGIRIRGLKSVYILDAEHSTRISDKIVEL
jgi:hypothetical protein